jgi:hypothetical protein
MMEIIAAGLPLKKQFLQRAYYPFGSDVCEHMGITPASKDVTEMEEYQAVGEVKYAIEEFFDFVNERAQWYLAAKKALEEMDHIKVERDLEDDLRAFALSILVEEFCRFSV